MELFSESQLENLNIDIMFAASSSYLISDISKKFSKRKIKNLFYTIFGIFLKESNQYIVFTNLFKCSKKTNDGNYFNSILIDHAIFDSKEEVLNHLYDFINGFEDHERIINEDLMHIGMIPAHQAYNYIILWNQEVFNYFNFLIQKENLKLTNKKNKI